MATKGKNLSSFSLTDFEKCSEYRIGIVVSEWNKEITKNLFEGAKDTLLQVGIPSKNISTQWVPGAFELPLGAQAMLESLSLDGIIAIGVVIQGETKHFDYVCSGTTQGIMDVMLKYNRPISFCVLTDNNLQQSIDRSGGKHGNKGIEAAVACLKMIQFRNSL